MKCQRCDSGKTRVVDSRESVDGRSVRRRRECESCGFRITTFERIEESLPMVVKKGGQRESFDRFKVLSGMKRACEKRPVSVLDLEDAVRGIEIELIERGDKEVSSEVIGELVIEFLRELDQVAYVRFASVYREFSDVQEFMDTLRQLTANTVRTGAANVISFGEKSLGAKKEASEKQKVRRARQLRFNDPEK